MIDDFNRIIKEEARKTLRRLLIITPIFLIGVVIILFSDFDVPIIPGARYWEYLAVQIAPILPPFALFILILVTINYFRRTKNPNAEKCIYKFCSQTDDPDATFKKLEHTWKYGLVLDEAEHIIKFLKPAKMPPIHISDEFAIGATFSGVNIVPLKNAVWVYSDDDNNLRIFYADGNKYSSKTYSTFRGYAADTASGIIAVMLNNNPDILVGKTKEAKALWRRKDINGLRDLARKNNSYIVNEEEYSKALELSLREEQARSRSRKSALLQFLTLVPALSLILLALFLGARSLDGSATALEVLQGYERWAAALFVVCLVSLLFVVAMNVFISAKLIKSKSFNRLNIIVGIVAIGVAFFIYSGTTSPLDRNAIREDIYAIKNNAFVTERYWIELTSLNNELRGIIPFNDFGERVVYRQNMIRVVAPSIRNNGVFFTPQFNADYLRTIAASDEYMVWERSPNRRYFLITHTPNFRLAVDIVPTTDRGR